MTLVKEGVRVVEYRYPHIFGDPVIWRFFRRRAQTTTEEEKRPEHSVRSESTSTHAPSMSAFSFQAPEKTVDSVEIQALDTVVDEVPRPEPEADLASALRERTEGRRRGQAAIRGVRPVLVPSLDELAVSWRIGAIQAERARPNDAIDLWHAYLTLCPADIDAWMRLGQAALMAEDVEVASQAFLEVCDRDPQNGLAQGALGHIAAQHRYFDEAVQRYTAAAALRPGCTDMLTELMRCQKLAGDLPAAENTRIQLQRLELNEE